MAVNNNLYPPLVETYAPTFLIDSGITNQDVCIIPFSLSAYNTTEDIGENAVQVIVSYQNTNKNALSLSEWPSGVMLTSANFKEDGRTGEIHIHKKDLENNGFNINQYYKIQIRFTGTKEVLVDGMSQSAITNIPADHGYDTWLTKFQAAFSEWSTVVLARGISTPQLNLYTFDKTQQITQFNTFNVHVAGELTFANPKETDSLKYYNIKLYSEDSIFVGDEIFATENIYNEGNSYSKNEINYLFKYALKEGENYFLVLEYETETGFIQSQEYNFIILIDSSSERNDIQIKAEEDNEEGRVKISLYKKTLSSFDTSSIIAISRANSKDGFGIWEDVHITTLKEVKDTKLDYVWYDYTAEAGTLYKYAVQKINAIDTKRSLPNKTETLITLSPEYWFLVANNEQFKIKYNPKMSSYKHVVSEAKIDTIGSKYPFIKRNGYVEYRSFPISGTISITADEAETLFSKNEDYINDDGDYIAMDEYRVLDLYDINLEKQFREKVLKFLYRNDVKLFKSATEGNILVKLMDITFTPNSVLGNLIYDFTCTAHEIAEFNTENCNKYNIQTVNVNPVSTKRAVVDYIPDSVVGIIDESIPAGENITTLIAEQIEEEGYEKYVQSITQLKIKINSDPYLIQDVDGVPTKADANTDLNDAYLGYIVKLNGASFVISFEGIYNLTGSNVDINSVVFLEDTDAQIQYVADIIKIRKAETSISNISYMQKLGQLWGAFNPGENLYTKIANRYYEEVEGEYIQKLISINSVRVDAEENAVFYLKTSNDTEVKKYIVPEGNLLIFYDENSVIEEMYFYGKDGEANPSPVEAAVNYECDIMKGYYAN